MASNEEVKNEKMRTFSSGATRNVDTERSDPEGFLSWRPLEAYFEFMHRNRFQKDGKLRDSDNWQLGIPQRAYGKSLWRHFFDFWKQHRIAGNHLSEPSPYRNEKLIEDGCAIMFNIMGYMDVELQKPLKSTVVAELNKLANMTEPWDAPPVTTTRIKRSQFLDDQCPQEADENNYQNDYHHGV